MIACYIYLCQTFGTTICNEYLEHLSVTAICIYFGTRSCTDEIPILKHAPDGTI